MSPSHTNAVSWPGKASPRRFDGQEGRKWQEGASSLSCAKSCAKYMIKVLDVLPEPCEIQRVKHEN